ncbi:hypothetical protein BY458DRAFT_494154 [Sporodiniella umbellata]|nr:hypothetical protein BY458DRAFT_494154 [Sporodiniella umbellata]
MAIHRNLLFTDIKKRLLKATRISLALWRVYFYFLTFSGFSVDISCCIFSGQTYIETRKRRESGQYVNSYNMLKFTTTRVKFGKQVSLQFERHRFQPQKDK